MPSRWADGDSATTSLPTTTGTCTGYCRWQMTADFSIVNLALWMVEKIFPIHEFFEEVEVKESEFLILMMISLFSGGRTTVAIFDHLSVVTLTTDGREQAQRAREKYSVLLGQLIQEEHPQLTKEDKLHRLQRLLGAIPLVKVRLSLSSREPSSFRKWPTPSTRSTPTWSYGTSAVSRGSCPTSYT